MVMYRKEQLYKQPQQEAERGKCCSFRGGMELHLVEEIRKSFLEEVTPEIGSDLGADLDMWEGHS